MPETKAFLDNPMSRFKVEFKPYVMYRDDVGISTDKNHELREEVIRDLNKMKEQIFTRNSIGKVRQYFNLYYYKYSLEKRMTQIIYSYFDESILEYKKCMNESNIAAVKHLAYIGERADAFLKDITDS